jgi:hypothetical protein
MRDASRKSYSIRLPERIAAELEVSASQAGITPTTLIQQLIIGKFDTGAHPDTNQPATSVAVGASADSERRQQERHRQLLYEVGKMRSVLLHALDHTLNPDAVDRIIEAAEATTREYVDGLLGSKESAR